MALSAGRIGLALALACAAVRAEEPLPDVKRLQSSPVLRDLKPNPMASEARTPAEKTLAQMYLPEGFRAVLVASEPEVRQPVAFAIDARGRLWVAEAYSYPQKQPPGKGLDRVVIFEDADGDGRFESRKVFTTGLNLVSGIEVGFGGVWIGAAPELLFIPDKDGDDVPDSSPQVLLEGFGYQDTHECLNSFTWGPDGWLYGNQGVFNFARIGKPGTATEQRTELRAGVWRYHPLRHEFEVFAHGGSNPWGLDYDETGQLFMTHCRSYWGRGLTTHVLQGGQFWNQANANYPPFIVSDPSSDFPNYQNFLLASARYDHGAGGAGPKGSDAIYGGHSHVGTMIYLGDNWPDDYRGHLFTHNLGGHQINQQINKPLGSGYDTVHAGKDVFFCTDPKYVAIDLQYGPDGAVYVIDWYDQQHCHNPISERWDRANGRIYRLEHAAGYKPARVNLTALNDLDLVKLMSHKNQWYPRTARRVLMERASAKPIDKEAVSGLRTQLSTDAHRATRLNTLWTLHGIGVSSDILPRLLNDKDEVLRAWSVQLATERAPITGAVIDRLVSLARVDPSPIVRRYLASAIQRIPEKPAWDLIEGLASRHEDREDRNLPLLLWHGLGPRMEKNPARAMDLAAITPIPQLADWIYWYAATLKAISLNQVIILIGKTTGETQRRRLAGLSLAMESRVNTPEPSGWKSVAPILYASEDPRVRRQAERLASVFGDTSVFARLRKELLDPGADKDARRHALDVLGRSPDLNSLSAFIKLLDEPSYRGRALTLLGRFDDASITPAILDRFQSFAPAEKTAAINALTSRASLAVPLLEAVAKGALKRDQLTAYHVRQLGQLHNPEVDSRLTKTWGRILKTPAERQTQITRLEKVFDEAPLWAYDGREGRKHFQKICASCHKLGDDGNRIGPELTGAGAHGIRYYLENIVDPDAVIGTDFQMTTIETSKGEVLSGLLVSETPSSITLRTIADQVLVAKTDAVRRATSEKSLMPEGLLEALPEREQIELLKFLTEH